MRTKLVPILTTIALLGTIHGQAVPTSGCTAQAWVRAPDLSPNTIVEGDARVKISAECPTIDSISLGLRFKERSFAKVLKSRENVTQLNNPIVPTLEFLTASPWPSHLVNKSHQEAYDELLTDRDLWIVREEERTVFEATQPFDVGVRNHGVLLDAVQDFTVLVPSTNFPPGLELNRYSVPGYREVAIVEWIYEYFARVSFSNGTTKDIFAGFTSFQPVHDPTNAMLGPRSITTGLDVQRGMGEERPTANYSIEIGAEPGLAFFAGTKTHVVNAIVTRTGFARAFSAPLNVTVCVLPSLSPKWAVEYDISNSRGGLIEHSQRVPSALRIQSDGRKRVSGRWRFQCSDHVTPVTMPNSSWDEIQAQEIVTTTSAQFTIPFEVDDAYIADFESYYQTLGNSLSITLNTPPVQIGDVDPDDPFGGRRFGWSLPIEDDEEAWVPWEKPTQTRSGKVYSGSVSVVVHPAEEVVLPQHCLAESMVASDQAVLSDDVRCKRRSLTHYLDEGARGPTFVNRSAVRELHEKSIAERDLHAPALNPVLSSPLEGEELVFRYYPIYAGRQPIYVGETWIKKVVAKRD